MYLHVKCRCQSCPVETRFAVSCSQLTPTVGTDQSEHLLSTGVVDGQLDAERSRAVFWLRFKQRFLSGGIPHFPQFYYFSDITYMYFRHSNNVCGPQMQNRKLC